MTLDQNVLCISRVLWLRDDEEGKDTDEEVTSSCIQVQKNGSWPIKHRLLGTFPKLIFYLLFTRPLSSP